MKSVARGVCEEMGRVGGSRMMRRIDALLMIAIAAIGLLSGTSSAQPRPAREQSSPAEKKILIVYLYPTDYHATVQQVVHENETGYLPPLKTTIEHIEQYDVLFLGFPTWDMQLPPPVKSFLHQYNLKGKTVIPFNTNAGYGSGSSFQTVTELCPGSTVLQGFSTRAGAERDGQYLVIQGARELQARQEVDNWLKTLGMLK